MERCDVLIVGGGPAGSTCAWKLRQAGLHVVVLEKKRFPRDKPCAGWITPQVVDALRLDIGDYQRENVWQPINGFRTGLIGGPAARIRCGETVSYGIRRCEFDAYLLRRSDADCRFGEAVRSINRQARDWVLNQRFSSPILVGAGGHFCPVAKLLGARRVPGATVVKAKEIEFEVAPECLPRVVAAPETPELFFCEDLGGYGWIFRKGRFLNIGLGRTEKSDLSRHVSAFCDFLMKRGRVGCDIPSAFVGHAYQLYRGPEPKLIDDGSLLIGDAAGLAYSQSGEGIRPAVESGLLAADTILKAGGQYGLEALAPYPAKVASRFGQRPGQGAAQWLPAASRRFLASQLLANRWFARRVVVDRWFLRRSQAALPH